MGTKHRFFALAALLIFLAASVDASQRKAYVGRRVADVLRELQSDQLRIIFSSDLVPPTLLVAAEPKPASPRDLAQQILESQGLTLTPGPRGRLLVVPLVRAGASQAPQSAPATDQPPVTPPSSAPPADAEGIRIEERVEVVDRLDSDPVEPGVYSVEPQAVQETAGGLEDVMRALQMLPGAAATNDRDGKMAVRGDRQSHVSIDGRRHSG